MYPGRQITYVQSDNLNKYGILQDDPPSDDAATSLSEVGKGNGARRQPLFNGGNPDARYFLPCSYGKIQERRKSVG